MIAFFDTNMYIDYLRGVLPAEMYLRYFQTYIMRMCPIVYHELVRGIRTPSVARKVKAVAEKIIFLPPPTTAMWTLAGQLMQTLHASSHQKTAEQIQNDMLIALTARQTGATLITRDQDFQQIRRKVSFEFILHPAA